VLEEFQKVCTTPYVRGVNAQSVEAYHAALRKGGLTVSKCKGKQGLSERTIANKQDRLRSFFRFLKLDTKWMPGKPKYEQEKLFLAKITIGCRIKYINRVSNSALSHVKLALCSAH
jgi:hypothetical protein